MIVSLCGTHGDAALGGSEWTVSVWMLLWIILRSTGARTANPEQSVPAPQRWVSHLLSGNKETLWDLVCRRYLHLLSSLCARWGPQPNSKFTHIKPTACHNGVDLFIGQLGAVEAQAPGHLLHYFRVVKAFIRKSSQSVHLPHENP